MNAYISEIVRARATKFDDSTSVHLSDFKPTIQLCHAPFRLYKYILKLFIYLLAYVILN